MPRNTQDEILEQELSNQEIVLFCGIANPNPLVNYLQTKGNKVHLIKFPDHHNYSDSDFDRIKTEFDALSSSNKIILTTEKDMQRTDTSYFNNYPLYYIPIHLQSADHQQITFDHFIENYISQNLN